MSWDVIVVNPRGALADPASLPDDFEPEPLGAAQEVRALITAALPGVDWSDPSWGFFEGEGFAIELNLGEEDPVRDAVLHVRGEGDPLPSVVAVCLRGGWLAYDTIEGEPLDLSNPSRAGWETFCEFRDQAMEYVRLGDLEGLGEAPDNDENALPDADLFIENGRLAERLQDEVFQDFALSDMRELRFGKGIHTVPLVIGAVAIGLAAASKLWIPVGWLSWVATVLLGLLAIPFLTVVYGEVATFKEGGTTHSLPLYGEPDAVARFRTALRRAYEEAQRGG